MKTNMGLEVGINPSLVFKISERDSYKSVGHVIESVLHVSDVNNTPPPPSASITNDHRVPNQDILDNPSCFV